MGFEREIRLERNLTIGEPRFLGAAAVVPLTAPGLHRIQHPGAHFREGEDIFATAFIVHEEAWRERPRHD